MRKQNIKFTIWSIVIVAASIGVVLEGMRYKMAGVVKNMTTRLGICFCLVLLSCSAYSKNKIDAGKNVFGISEYAFVFKDKIKFKTRLDTGAMISSLLATNIKKTKSKTTGKRWVSFQTIDPQTGKLITKKFPLKRYMKIKQHRKRINGKFRYMKRPVIMLPVCLGKQSALVEINLVDRSHFLHPLLLGTSALRQLNAIVDPNKEYTSTPTCEVMP